MSSTVSKLIAIFGATSLSVTYDKDNATYTDSKTTLSFARADAANPEAAPGLYTVAIGEDQTIVETLVPVAPKPTATNAKPSAKQSPATGYSDKASR